MTSSMATLHSLVDKLRMKKNVTKKEGVTLRQCYPRVGMPIVIYLTTSNVCVGYILLVLG